VDFLFDEKVNLINLHFGSFSSLDSLHVGGRGRLASVLRIEIHSFTGMVEF